MEFTKEQKEVADQLKFKMEMHMNMETGGHLQHGCTYLGMKITQVVTTPKTKARGWGNGVTCWYIDDEKTEYKTPIELVDELIKRKLKITR